MNAAISIEHLAKRYGNVTAVRELSLSVNSGEIAGLIGADSAGKTTAIRMICGLLKPDSGTVKIAGFVLPQGQKAVKDHLGYMPQRFSLYPDLTVEENIHFFADLYQIPKKQRLERIDQLYHFSKLGPFRERRAGRLSGGMKQKLALCCNLIHEPDVMILDEPTFGVDPVSRRELWDILHSLRERGTALLVSTAYLDEAEWCDSIHLMHEGQIIASGALEELLQRYPYRLSEVVAENHTRQEFDAVRHELMQIHEIAHVHRFGDRLHVAYQSEVQEHSIHAIATHAAMQVYPVKPILEDLFVTLVTA